MTTTAAASVIPITKASSPVRKRTAGKGPSFQLTTTHVPNTHKAQATLDYGSKPGPWVSVGINETQIGIGYLPKKKK